MNPLSSRERPRLRSILIGTATLSLAAVILTGCSSAPTRTAVPLPAKNVDQWTMPLDQFVPVDTKAADYAENLLVEPCMQKAGYSWNVPYRDTTDDSGPAFNSVGRRVFNLSLAEQYGYHSPAGVDSTAAAWRAFAATPVSDAESAVLTKCIYTARRTLPRLPETAQLAGELGNQAIAAAAQDPNVKAAAQKWAKCMQDAGVSDLPDSPSGMPTDSMTDEFGLETAHTTAGPAEVRLATKDANCRTTSGWQQASYNSEWSHQVTLLTADADDLVRIRQQIAANRTAVLKVITEHAPQS